MNNNAFKALSDPTRRKILELLAKKGDMPAGELGSYFTITAPSLSHHLNLLKNAGLVQDTRQGQKIVYSLNTTVFQELVIWFYDVMGEGEKDE